MTKDVKIKTKERKMDRRTMLVMIGSVLGVGLPAEPVDGQVSIFDASLVAESTPGVAWAYSGEGKAEVVLDVTYELVGRCCAEDRR